MAAAGDFHVLTAAAAARPPPVRPISSITMDSRGGAAVPSAQRVKLEAATAAAPAPPPAWLQSPPLVVDNGAGTIKAGFASFNEPQFVGPNVTALIKKTARVLVADEVDSYKKESSMLYFTRPHDRGYIVNWPTEQTIFGRVFQHLKVDTTAQPLIMTAPVLAPEAITASHYEVLFEEYRFPSVCLVPPQRLVALDYATKHPDSMLAKTGCGLVVDSGFSFSHAVPIINLTEYTAGARRLNIGGKLLTNHLKEVISTRHWNMMDDPLVVNHIKEATCYVAQDFETELAACDPRSRRRKSHGAMHDRSILVEYVLPNFDTICRGYIKGSPDDPARGAGAPAIKPAAGSAAAASAEGSGADLQVLTLAPERFSIPEVLFRPADIGARQPGLHEVAGQALAATPSEYQPAVAATLVLCGGHARMTGYAERFAREVRTVVPAEFATQVVVADDPIFSAWQGGAVLGRSYTAVTGVSLTEFQEQGRRAWLGK